MLSENIKTIRKNKGFTQEELAARLHVTRQTLSKWEKGYSAGASYALDSETPESALPDNGLPVVVIEIDETEEHTIEDMNNSPDHSVECKGSMQIIVPDGFGYCDLDIAPESLGSVPLDYIRGRGNSTWKAAKKPYKIKLKDKADVFGL